MKRPDRTEAAAYYFTYIDQVPDGDICELLAAQLPTFVQLARRVTEQQSLHRYAADKWSIRGWPWRPRGPTSDRGEISCRNSRPFEPGRSASSAPCRLTRGRGAASPATTHSPCGRSPICASAT